MTHERDPPPTLASLASTRRMPNRDSAKPEMSTATSSASGSGHNAETATNNNSNKNNTRDKDNVDNNDTGDDDGTDAANQRKRRRPAGYGSEASLKAGAKGISCPPMDETHRNHIRKRISGGAGKKPLSWESLAECPICFDRISEAYITKCGHSFCHKCITRHLRTRKMCPVCKVPLDASQTFPNFNLSTLLSVMSTFQGPQGLLQQLPPAPSAASATGNTNNNNNNNNNNNKDGSTIGNGNGSRNTTTAAAATTTTTNNNDCNNSSSSINNNNKGIAAAAGGRISTVNINMSVGRNEAAGAGVGAGVGGRLQATAAAARGLGALLGGGANALRWLDPENLHLRIGGREELDGIISALQETRRRIDLDEEGVRKDVLAALLRRMRKEKARELARIQEELSYVDADLDEIASKPRVRGAPGAGGAGGSGSGGSSGGGGPRGTSSSSGSSVAASLGGGSGRGGGDEPLAVAAPAGPGLAAEDPEGSPTPPRLSPAPASGDASRDARVRSKRAKIDEHYSDLQAYYYSVRRRGEPLGAFAGSIANLTRYTGIKVLATLKFGDLFNNSNIVSCIDFDRDDAYFATGGVAKKIKIFDFARVVDNEVDVHYPLREMACQSKISCLSWNSYIKSQISSSDYEGAVTVWDADTGQHTARFREHAKRVWCVDFSPTDPTKLASGSDDMRVKIWSTNQPNSTLTIPSKANVCCVKFNPTNANHIAFGSADHCIHYYDTRHTSRPLKVYRGHAKAVSYVKFMSETEFVSASTDSSLKLWSVNSTDCVRTFSGHVNEKNFVGLACNEDFIACGSETNSVHLFCKSLSHPIMRRDFRPLNPATGEELRDEEPSQFVSAVCWKRSSDVLVAANSQGTIKACSLVEVDPDLDS